MACVDSDDHEGDLADIDSVKQWLRLRREAAKITQDELAVFMGATSRVVLNAEKEGDPKAGLPRGYPFFRMLQRLGVVVPGAPVPAGPTLHDRLSILEEKVELLPTKEEFQLGLDVLREAIDARANRDTRQGSDEAAGGTL